MVIKETPVTRKRGAHVGEFPHRQLEAIVRYLHRIVRPLPKVQSAGRRAATETVLRAARNSAGIMNHETQVDRNVATPCDRFAKTPCWASRLASSP